MRLGGAATSDRIAAQAMDAAGNSRSREASSPVPIRASSWNRGKSAKRLFLTYLGRRGQIMRIRERRAILSVAGNSIACCWP